MVKALAIDALSFGSETADLDALVDIAKRMDCKSTQEQLRTYIKEGMSYGAAFRKALDTEILNTPNALLGLEYIRAGLAYNAKLEYIPILRTSNHHEETLTDELPSGTALRQLITSTGNLSSHFITSTGNLSSQLQATIPPSITSDMTQVIENGNYVNYNRYHDMVHSLSRVQCQKS